MYKGNYGGKLFKYICTITITDLYRLKRGMLCYTMFHSRFVSYKLALMDLLIVVVTTLKSSKYVESRNQGITTSIVNLIKFNSVQ